MLPIDSTTSLSEQPSLANSPNPLKKLIPKRTKLRNFEGCSTLKDYEVQEKIGEGTFGEVHKACNRKTKEVVALKRILMHNEKDGFPITALREIKILKQLSHPNVIRLSDMVVERGDKTKKKRGSIYMATPYMDHDLCGLLDNPKVEFSVPQIKCYARQLLEGTAYLHRMNIIHRDMKAANLLISNEGILQIADFGLARIYYDEPPPESKERRREYTSMVVTRWYRPPELLLGERHYTPAIDLWGIGCILAEMYKGKPILQGPNDVAQLDMIFQLCGTPTEITMPGWTLLPGCEGIKSFKTWERRLEREYRSFDPTMVELLAHLLCLDPVKRFKATQALDHAYFTSDPLPADPTDLPTYEASHELDKSKYHASRAEAKNTLAPRPPAAAGEMGNERKRQREDEHIPQRRRTPVRDDRRARTPPRHSSVQSDRREGARDEQRPADRDIPKSREGRADDRSKERTRDRSRGNGAKEMPSERGSDDRADKAKDDIRADRARDERRNGDKHYDERERPRRNRTPDRDHDRYRHDRDRHDYDYRAPRDDRYHHSRPRSTSRDRGRYYDDRRERDRHRDRDRDRDYYERRPRDSYHER